MHALNIIYKTFIICQYDKTFFHPTFKKNETPAAPTHSFAHISLIFIKMCPACLCFYGKECRSKMAGMSSILAIILLLQLFLPQYQGQLLLQSQYFHQTVPLPQAQFLNQALLNGISSYLYRQG